jgi:uncharacterized Zn-binding protein involved in type VI secretion
MSMRGFGALANLHQKSPCGESMALGFPMDSRMERPPTARQGWKLQCDSSLGNSYISSGRNTAGIRSWIEAIKGDDSVFTLDSGNKGTLSPH